MTSSLGFLEDQLTSYEEKYYQDYAPTDIEMDIPTQILGPETAEQIEYDVFSQTGGWGLYHDYSKKINMVNLQMEKHYRKVAFFAEGAEWTDMQLKRYQAEGISLATEKIDAIYEQYQDLLHNIAWNADGSNTYGGTYGLINQPFITVTQNNSGKSWKNSASLSEKVSDMNYALNLINTNTYGKVKGNTILMPVADFSVLKQSKYDTGSDTTALEFFLRTNPGVRVEERWFLKDKVFDFGTKDVFIAYNNSRDNLTFRITLPITRKPTEFSFDVFTSWFKAGLAGVIVKKPLTVVVQWGI